MFVTQIKLKTILKVLISTHQICWGSFVAFTFDHQFLTPYWIWILNSQVMVNLRFGISLLLRPCSPMILLNLLMLILEKKEEPWDIGMGLLGDNMPKMCLNTLIFAARGQHKHHITKCNQNNQTKLEEIEVWTQKPQFQSSNPNPQMRKRIW